MHLAVNDTLLYFGVVLCVAITVTLLLLVPVCICVGCDQMCFKIISSTVTVT